MKNACGEDAVLGKFCTVGVPWQNQQRHLSNGYSLDAQNPGGGIAMPSRAMIEKYKAGFESSFVSRVFPILDPVYFEETLDRAYAESAASTVEGRTAQACVCVSLAFFDVDHDFTSLPPSIDRDLYAAKAQSNMAEIVTYPESMDVLQTVILLVCLPFDPLGPRGIIAQVMSSCHLQNAYLC